MTFKLEQILSDPDLRCPQGEVKVQLRKPDLHSSQIYALINRLSKLLTSHNIPHTYHGNGLFTIHNS